MNIRAITPSFKGNIRFTNTSTPYNKEWKYKKTETIEIPAEKIISYCETRETRETKEYSRTPKTSNQCTTQITDETGQKYKFSLPLENIKTSVEMAKNEPNETFEIPQFIGMA